MKNYRASTPDSKSLKNNFIFYIWLITFLGLLILSVTKYQANPRQFLNNHERKVIKAITTYEPININIANQADLIKLPGIGPRRAAMIIAYRDEHGKFNNISELKNVPGISKFVLNNIKKFIIV